MEEEQELLLLLPESEREQEQEEEGERGQGIRAKQPRTDSPEVESEADRFRKWQQQTRASAQREHWKERQRAQREANAAAHYPDEEHLHAETEAGLAPEGELAYWRSYWRRRRSLQLYRQELQKQAAGGEDAEEREYFENKVDTEAERTSTVPS